MCPLHGQLVSRSVAGPAGQNVTASLSPPAPAVCPVQPRAADLQPHARCTYPAYFTFFTVLILSTQPVQVELRHVLKLPLLLVTAALHAWVNVFWLGDVLDCMGSSVYHYQGWVI